MTRLCDDCGIPRWQSCICVDEGRVDHEAELREAEHARRVAIQHAITARADELRRALDPAALPQTPDEWTARLVGSLGCVACAGEHGEVEHYIVEHAAMVLLWLENLVAESAR